MAVKDRCPLSLPNMAKDVSWFSSFLIKSDEKCCNKHIYDVMSLILSIADNILTILIIIHFYNENKMLFFQLSMIILLYTNISHSLLLAARFIGDIDEYPLLALILFIFCIPFGQFMGIIVYINEFSV